jgi:cell shape-determining protein MreD
MKYFLYFILLYILLPLNTIADFIVILLFFVTISEHSDFAILYAFIAGLLVDLYYPSTLGLNMLLFLILVQVLLIIKTYVTKTLAMLFAMFTVFFLLKVMIHHIVIAFSISILFLIITLVCFFPVFGVLHKLVYRTWMKT